ARLLLAVTVGLSAGVSGSSMRKWQSERSAGLTIHIVYDILPLGEDHLLQNGGRGEPLREIPCGSGLERARRSGRRAEGDRDFRPARSRGGGAADQGEAVGGQGGTAAGGLRRGGGGG